MTKLIAPPSCPQLEKAVLAAVLMDDTHIHTIKDILVHDDFYDPKNREIYLVMLLMTEQNKRIDTLSLIAELESKVMLQIAGGEEYIIELQAEIPDCNMIEQYAARIKEKAILRSLISGAMSVIANCKDPSNEDTREKINNAEQLIFAITQKNITQPMKPLSQCLTETFKFLREASKNPSKGNGVMSGFHELDRMTSGFQSSDLIILAARPSMGKTALALNIAANAILNGRCFGFFSLEMSTIQLTLRLLSQMSKISGHRMRNAQISSDEWTTLTEMSALLQTTGFHIDETPSLSIMDLRAKARRLAHETRLDGLVIDYMQLITTSGKYYESKNYEMAAISAALKSLAKELNIPIIALSQLSRAVDKRPDNRPVMSDLRDSGAIEQDADLIIFLYRDVLYNNQCLDPEGAELIVAKHRNGPIGTINLRFNKELTKFESE
jgi:replicative DNA helicase